MSNIINPKPRFGYNPAADTIYDYVAQCDVPVLARYNTGDGAWDLIEVRRAILANETIEFARLSVVKPAPAAPGVAAAPAAPVHAAASSPPEGHVFGGAAAHAAVGMSAEQLQALKLLPLQMAAMGITPIQAEVTGVTALQVANWGLTPARADALQLTPEQRAVLLA